MNPFAEIRKEENPFAGVVSTGIQANPFAQIVRPEPEIEPSIPIETIAAPYSSEKNPFAGIVKGEPSLLKRVGTAVHKRLMGKEVISTPEGDFPIERLQDPDFRQYIQEHYPGVLESIEKEPTTFGERMLRQAEPTEALKWGLGILPIKLPEILKFRKMAETVRAAKEAERLRPVVKPYATVPITPVEAAKPVGLGIKPGIEIAKAPITPHMKSKIDIGYISKLSEEQLKEFADMSGIKWEKDLGYMQKKVVRELNKISEIQIPLGPDISLGAVKEIKPKMAKPEVKVEGIIPFKESLMEPTIRFDPHKEMAEAGTEAMVAKGIKRDPNKLMTEQLVEEWLANPAKYEEISSKYGVSSKEFANMMREQASSWGRKLGELGLEAQRLGKEIPEIGEALLELEKVGRTPGAMDMLQGWWKKFSNVWRGSLVTQLSTAMRNAEVQGGRVGLNVFEEGLNAGLQKVLGKPQTVHPLDGVDQLFRLFQRNKPLTERILKEFPKQHDRLFATYMSDIESAGMGGKIYKGISEGVDILNTANRFQEYTIRRAVFMGKLDQGLKAKGMDLTKIIEGNEIGKIPLDTIKSSVNSALEFTFAEQPKWGTIGRKFTDLVTSMPGATFVMPFPRFLVNSLKFQFDYSPLGMLKLLSPAERTAFSAGNMQVISRAILGTAMFGAAYQIRNSEYAGERWYELSVGGKTIDMRPYNPFVSYLFAADLVKKSTEGTLHTLTSKDIAMGVFSSNLRAGTGLYALDKILDGVTQTGDSEKTVNMIKQFGGEVASGFLTPLNQFKEAFTGFDDYIVREKRSEPFLGPIKEKIPFVEKGLPPLYSPTREEPVTRKLPLVRQVTGMMIKEKNEFERELDRLGFDYREILPSTGNPEADNLIAKYMGVGSQRVALPMIKTEAYKNLDDKVKGLFIKELLKEIRGPARDIAEEENPKLFAIIELEKTPRREKLLIKEPLEKAIGILKRK